MPVPITSMFPRRAAAASTHGTREHTQNVSLWPRSDRSKVGRAWREWHYGLPGCISWRRPHPGGLAGRQAGRVLTESKVLGAEAAADDEDGDRHGCLQQRTSSMQGGGVLVFRPASRPAKGGMAPCSWPADQQCDQQYNHQRTIFRCRHIRPTLSIWMKETERWM